MDNVAKVRKRVLSALIDYVLIMLLDIIYIVFFGEATEDGWSVHGLATLPIILLWFIYFPVIESFAGQTLGKKITGLTVIRKDGRDLSFGTCFQRHIFDPIDIAFAGLVAVLVMKYSGNKQRIGDLVAATIVVEDKWVKCENCNEELVLSRHEIISGRFTCPKCQHGNTLPHAGGHRHMELQDNII